MYVLCSLIVTALTILFTIFLKKQVYITRCLTKFPGPPKLPFFGNALDFLGDKGMLHIFLEYRKKYGEIVYGRLGPTIHTLLFCNADLAKTVFLANANLTKGPAYDLCINWLGQGLLTAPEEKWKSQRKMIMPAFNSQLLMDFIRIFDEQAKILITKLDSISPSNSTNIHTLVSLCSLDIISETSMGVSLKAQDNQNIDYVKSVKEMCRIIADKSLSLWKRFTLLHIFCADYRLEQNSLKVLHGYTDKVINERKLQREEKTTIDRKNQQSNDSVEKRTKMCLLDILLDYSEHEKSLTAKQIEQEVQTFLFAGHDTVTTAMSFFLFEVGRHPEVQKQIYEEQISIFGKDIGRKVDARDLHEMRYLEMVIKETLRMYPPVPVYTRMVTKEFIFDGKIIPEGVLLTHFCYGLHRNDKIFPGPDKFDPSRFENSDATISHSYLPFSTGPRNCIGQKFAMYEMKVILSSVLRFFEICEAEPKHILDLRAEIVLSSRNGIRIKIRKRENIT